MPFPYVILPDTADLSLYSRFLPALHDVSRRQDEVAINVGIARRSDRLHSIACPKLSLEWHSR